MRQGAGVSCAAAQVHHQQDERCKMMTYTNPALLSKGTKRKNFVSFLSIRKVVDAVAYTLFVVAVGMFLVAF